MEHSVLIVDDDVSLSTLCVHTRAPILMLTAKNDEADKVSGLRLGAGVPVYPAPAAT